MPLLYAVPGGEGGVDARARRRIVPRVLSMAFCRAGVASWNSPHHSAKRSIS